MNIKNLKIYTKYARQHGRRYFNQQAQDRRLPIAPAPHTPQLENWRDDELTVAWIGHATVLINFFGTWILTDPVMRSHVGVNLAGLTIGPRRLVHPALSANELPPLDAVLISHAHMDHCDLGTLKKLPRKTHVIVQQGNRDLVSRFAKVSEIGWGEQVTFKDTGVEAIEVNHWGARRLTDRHRGYGGFLITKGERAIVFGGDTAYTRAFSRLRYRGIKIELAILPIGAYNPYIYAHANPEQAWQMRHEMNANYILPMHHSTFRLGREPVGEPIHRLLKAAGDEGWRVCLTKPGETWKLPAREIHLPLRAKTTAELVAD
ncbi:MAG: MBL fold metallo-hydrolase [Acidobacteriota bacterium]